MYEQLAAPNLTIVGQDGECLVYVREVFGVAPDYPTAIAAWAAAQYQHAGEQPPADNAVPIWFNWETDGHVAVWDNGTIYSTTAQGDKTFASISDLVNFIGEGIVYLGWSEDINGTRIVEEESMDFMSANVVTEEDNRQLFLAWCARNPDPQEVGRYVGKTVAFAWNDIAQNSNRVDLNTMMSAYYANGSKIPSSSNPTALSPGIYEVK